MRKIPGLLIAVAILGLTSFAYASEGMEKVKLKGDFRFRYQWEDNSHTRGRARIRLRVGAVVTPSEHFKIGCGLATGGYDPRSTNLTLDDGFESKDVKLDYAYAEYSGVRGMIVWGGKYKGIKEAVWSASDLLWDSDLRPEGAGVKFDFGSVFANAGLWVLDEEKTEADALMFYAQPGVEWHMTENFGLKTAVAYYNSISVKGKVLKHSSETNTLENDGLKYDYDVWAPSVKVEVKNLTGFVPYIALFGDYVKNPDPDQENQGYLVGLKFGNKKVKKFGNWQFKYMYRGLEKDAWLDIFPDSDTYGGKTGVKGHEAEFKFGLAKNLALGLDYYNVKQTDLSAEENPLHLLQVDLVWKF
ncbi:MAG: putative porin [Candidatus Atribacteria bacterium]|nr:putative porin [Candidatus Atribacteria bacterium]MCD6350342.1 putative porin [Candidatus Atribacteria bacterium]